MQYEEPRGGPRGPDPDEHAEPTTQQVVDEISRDILAIHRNSYGRSAASAEAHLLDDNTIVVVLGGVELLPAEEFLIVHGHKKGVVAMREQYEKTIETTFRATVERATGRRVVGFTSRQSLDPPRFATAIFKLAPA